MWRERENICETRQHWNANFFPLSLSSLYNFAHLRDTCIIQTFTYYYVYLYPQIITKQNGERRHLNFFIKSDIFSTSYCINNWQLLPINFCKWVHQLFNENHFAENNIGGCEFIQDWQIFWDTHKNGCLHFILLMNIHTY